MTDNECIWCLAPPEPGDKLRSVHPTLGLVHPQYHTYPDGGQADGTPIPDACEQQHKDEHIHERCTEAYCNQVGLTFVPGQLTSPEPGTLIELTHQARQNYDNLQRKRKSRTRVEEPN